MNIRRLKQWWRAPSADDLKNYVIAGAVAALIVWGVMCSIALYIQNKYIVEYYSGSLASGMEARSMFLFIAKDPK